MVVLGRSLIRTALSAPLVLFAIGVASAEAPVPGQADTARVVAELSKQVHELRIELTTLRLAWQEQRMQTLEKQIQAAERERRLVEFEDADARNQVLAAEVQLAGSDLDGAERAELVGLKNALLTEGQQRLGQSRTEAAERESMLRGEWEREKTAAEELRRTLDALRHDATPVSGSKPAP